MPGIHPWFSVVDRETFRLRNGPQFDKISGPVDFHADFSPEDYFNMFLQNNGWSFIEHLVVETNRYAQQCIQTRGNERRNISNWNPTNVPEMKAFLGLILAMGVVRKPTIASYWEAGEGLTKTSFFRTIMPRNRFQSILRYIHCNDNETAPRRREEYDPTHKIAPVIDFFNAVFEKNYRLSEDIVVDERIVGFKGRHVLKQYISNKKAHRWGAKLWVLAESRTGYTHHINVYKGRRYTETSQYGQGYKVVMDLVRPHLGNYHHVVMDNFFTSPKLFHDLRNRGTYATGVVLANRKGMPQSFKTTRLPKGEVVAKSQGPLLAVLFSDRRHVKFLTTSETARTIRIRNSKGREMVVPSVVHKYNTCMGGVDLGDQFLAKFEPRIRCAKMWKKILFNLLTTATVNAYICYKNCFFAQRKMSHFKFQKKIINSLVANYREENTRRGQIIPALTAPHMRHFIYRIPNNGRRKCAMCTNSRSYKKTRINTWCPDCGVGLCIGNCFRDFHLSLPEE